MVMVRTVLRHPWRPAPSERRTGTATVEWTKPADSPNVALRPYCALHAMNLIFERANPWLHDLVSYIPGKPIEDVARELGIEPEKIVKLASNENPLGPTPVALKAMEEALRKAHFYPDGGG